MYIIYKYKTIHDYTFKITPDLVAIFLNPGQNIAVWVLILKPFLCRFQKSYSQEVG